MYFSIPDIHECIWCNKSCNIVSDTYGYCSNYCKERHCRNKWILKREDLDECTVCELCHKKNDWYIKLWNGVSFCCGLCYDISEYSKENTLFNGLVTQYKYNILNNEYIKKQIDEIIRKND
jgi:hypothetical protein